MSSNKDNKLLHRSVLLNEVISCLEPKNNEVYVDCTFGAGGYSSAILNAADCVVYGIDRDESVKIFADELKQQYPTRFHFVQGKFGDLGKLMKNENIDTVDAIILDLGVSSMQLDQGDRGFSFSKDAKLDMRMGKTTTLTAYDVVNQTSETDLADIIYNYGDEVKSRHIAKKIVETRKKKPIETTTELADIVRSFYPKNPKMINIKIDPATKTFQAIRIYVNDELGELERVLDTSKTLLKTGGRLIIVTFHSLEDRIVKNFMRKESGFSERKVSKYKQTEAEGIFAFTLGSKKPIVPSIEEIKNNIRSRSAKLRYAIKN